MKNKKKSIALVLCVALVGTLVFGSFAYFTDRETAQVTGTAGTVDIQLTSDVELLDADGKNILNPGDMRAAGFAVENVGNKSVDVRETVILTSSVPMTEENGQAEFEIYAADDVMEIEGYGYVPYTFAANDTYTAAKDAYAAFLTDGGEAATYGLTLSTPAEVRTMSDDGTKITYFIDGIVLDGKSVKGDYTDAELDTTAEAANAKTSSASDYVLVFRGSSSNAFQNATLTMDILAEAKQHRNTNGNDWSNVAQESVSFGGADIQAVPQAVVTPGA